MGEKIFNTDDLESGNLTGRRRRRTERRTIDEALDLSDITARTDEEDIDLEAKEAMKENEESSMSGQLYRSGSREERRRMRITMLGVSGSGKTAFLSGVYQAMMMNEFHDLQLTPSGDVDEAFQQIGEIGNIALLNQDNYDFPDGTLDTTIFPLALENGGETVCDFDFTDYAGGDILNIFKTNEEVTPGARALKSQLLASDAILIFADAYVLCKGKNIADWQKATGASYIAPLFSTLVKAMDPDRAMTVLFVLTKTDDERIPEEMKANNFARLTERMVRTFGSIHQKAQKHIRMDGILV